MYQPKGVKKIFHQTRRFFAKHWLSLFHPIQIAITGSQGKTSTTQYLAKILSVDGPTVVTDTNLDTNFNVPITALKTRPWTKYIVWELGVDHIGEMDNHLQIAKPQIGIITGISPVHTDKEHFGSLKNLLREKRKLIERLPNKKQGGVAILNYDNQYVRQMATSSQAQIIFYGSDKNHCQIYFDPKKINITLDRTTFVLTYKNQDYGFKTKLIGEHHPYNFAAIFACLIAIFNNPKKSYHLIETTLNEITPLRGRMNIEKGPRGTMILNDSLRANPESTNSGLKTFYQIPYQKGRKIAVLGVMGELYDPVLEHKKTAEAIIKYPPDIVIGVGEFRKFTIEELQKKGFSKDKAIYTKNVIEAADVLKKIIKKGDFIYLKGSLLRNLWRIIKLLNNQPICCNNDLCPYEHCYY
jgi:UDP-N-acetylmuramoyl-tripeptide--D-alanyl-D-alanine ligase